jgi:hypothetical protein
MNLVIIQRRYNDGDTPSQAILGWVKTEYGESDIDRFWKNWQEEVPEPNCDYEFIEWLLKKPGFFKVEESIFVAVCD